MEKTNFESYIEGINEAWKVFIELSSLSQDAIAEIFCIPTGVNTKTAVFNLPPEQIIKEYNAHQEKLKREKEINVGDVVYHIGRGIKGLVMEACKEVYFGSTLLIVCREDKHFERWDEEKVVKCNKHIEVMDWILNGIEEAEVL